MVAAGTGYLALGRCGASSAHRSEGRLAHGRHSWPGWRRWPGARLPDRGVRGRRCSASTWCSTCSWSWWPRRCSCSGAPITLLLRAARPGMRRALLRRPAQHPDAGPLLPAAGVAPVRRRQLGLALLHPVRPGAREPGAPLRPARDLPGAALLFWWPVSAPIPRHGACPTRCASSTSSWRCRRTRSWASRSWAPARVLYPHYLTNLRTWGPSALDDQSLGGDPDVGRRRHGLPGGDGLRGGDVGPGGGPRTRGSTPAWTRSALARRRGGAAAVRRAAAGSGCRRRRPRRAGSGS